ncbi:site-specific integrase [Aureispira sp. CCB-E]|uniref:site-specific integrase n=1 Tax=Aureispira sp. CCB-E TaxID=3051121 RepID=UPI002868CF7E|nr:site-specific integrase [Aureispira sp. CCB-E]WMX12428.1 site-specific integrase [Aureispira sp. CCB-E]
MIQFKLIYNVKKKTLQDGTASIQIRAYQSPKRRYIATGLYVKPNQWSKRFSKVVDHPNANEYNAELMRQLVDLENYVFERVRRLGAMTMEQLDDYFKGENNDSFTDFWERELEQDPKLQKTTKKKQRTALNYWKKFKKDVQFSELTYQLIRDFDRFLYQHQLHTNTVYTHHKQVKKYINLAVRSDLLDFNKNPYLKFKPKTAETQRLVLSMEEVERLEGMAFSTEEFYLELVRDMFLFSCYTGLRFSDTSKLKYEDINHDREGMTLNLVAKKTQKQLLLPLYKLHQRKPEAIIEKYREEVLYERGLIFHAYSNQYFNRTLKELAARAEILKPITSHVARHTFATHLAGKVPIHVLKAILQHSKIETTMVYLHLSNKIVKDALDGVEW